MLLSGKCSRPRGDPGAQDGGESARLRALDSFGILDSPPEEPFDGLTALAADVCDVPMSLISFVDAERQWIKSRHGIDITEVARELSFCAHTIAVGTSLVEIPDIRGDARFADHPMVRGEPHLRFYAGVPIVTDEGHRLGALCVMDRVPRQLVTTQRRHLQTLARQVLYLLELRSQGSPHPTGTGGLRQQQLMLDGVLERTDVLIFAKDVEGRYVMANHALEYVTQADRPMIGGTDYDFFAPEDADEYRRNDLRIMQSQEWQVFPEEAVHPDGSVHTYRSTKFPLFGDGGEVIGVGGVSTDVTELATARAAHAAAEERWRSLVERSAAAVIVVDAEGNFAYVNPEAVALLGATTADEIAHRPALSFVPDRMQRAAQVILENTLSGEQPIRAQKGALRQLDGTEIAVEFYATAVDHSGELTMQLEVRDVSAVAAAHAALIHSATTDALTGVLNRKAWDERVAALIERYGETAPLTIAVIDLDNFKSFNDTRGHTAGDALLQQFATAAGGSIRPDDVFARWGGEEFIVALPQTPPEHAVQILNRLRDCVPWGQTCSIGYTEYLPDDTLIETVVRADKAVYQAKSQGRNQLARN